MSLVPLDLSAAVFLLDGVGGNPNGQYGDGVIYTYGSPGYPDFFFPSHTLDPTQPCDVEITFDPTSPHDAGGRQFWLSGVTSGNEQTDYLTIFTNYGDLWDGSANTADVVSVTIGPGVNGWDDPTLGVAAGFDRIWFETDNLGAVSQIRVTGSASSVVSAPGVRGGRPLRQFPRSDGLGMSSHPRLYPPPRSAQASNRRAGGYN